MCSGGLTEVANHDSTGDGVMAAVCLLLVLTEGLRRFGLC